MVYDFYFCGCVCLLEQLQIDLQILGTSTRSTQTAAYSVSVGLQTDSVPSSRGLQSKAWSPRPTASTTNPLASARSRHISTSLDKVHSRIERSCCSPKYGSPKLQRRVSSGLTIYLWDRSKCDNNEKRLIIRGFVDHIIKYRSHKQTSDKPFPVSFRIK